MMNRTKSLIAAGALAGSALLGGGAAMAAFQPATADTVASTTAAAAATATTTDPAATPPAHDPSQGGHVGANGTKEELLTGDTKTQAEAAALAAVPGGTVERVETDAEGATYEAHMTEASGNHVTVKLDANFAVTGTETGGQH